MGDPYDGTSLIPDSLLVQKEKEVHYFESFTSGAFKAVEVAGHEKTNLMGEHTQYHLHPSSDPAEQENIMLGVRAKLYNRLMGILIFFQVNMTK